MERGDAEGLSERILKYLGIVYPHLVRRRLYSLGNGGGDLDGSVLLRKAIWRHVDIDRHEVFVFFQKRRFGVEIFYRVGDRHLAFFCRVLEVVMISRRVHKLPPVCPEYLVDYVCPYVSRGISKGGERYGGMDIGRSAGTASHVA